jgi:hypothetical protein
MSKATEFLHKVFLEDSEGKRSRIISIRGCEQGLDYLEITTQSTMEKLDGVATRHCVYTEEISVDDIDKASEEMLKMMPPTVATLQ